MCFCASNLEDGLGNSLSDVAYCKTDPKTVFLEDAMNFCLKTLFAAMLLSAVPVLLAQDAATDVKKGADDTGHATKVAAKDTAKGTEKAADKTGHATEVAAKDTAKGTEKVADKTGHEVKEAAEDTGHGIKKVGEKLEDKPADKPAPQL